MLSLMIDAVIFDFDGTLVDSEPNYALSDVAMVRHFGGTLTFEEHHDFIGMGADKFIKAMRERYGITAPTEEIRRVQDAEYLKLARENTPVFPEMLRLLQELKKRKIPMAIASGTSLELLHLLSQQAGIREYFQVILSSEQVDQGKPEPDVFLEAARRLGMPPEHCLVLEDSIPGAEAAVKAGMDLIVMPGEYQLDRVGDFPEEGLVLPRGMVEFRAAMVLERLSGEPIHAGN